MNVVALHICTIGDHMDCTVILAFKQTQDSCYQYHQTTTRSVARHADEVMRHSRHEDDWTDEG
jgi:hypothetical protein